MIIIQMILLAAFVAFFFIIWFNRFEQLEQRHAEWVLHKGPVWELLIKAVKYGFPLGFLLYLDVNAAMMNLVAQL